MPVTLPESGRRRQRSFAGSAASTLVHGLVIGGVVVTTGYADERLPMLEKPEHVVLVAPRTQEPERPAPPPRPLSRPDIATNLETPPPVDLPPISLTIRDGLPPIDARIGTMTMTMFSGSPLDTLAGTRHTGVADQPFTEMMVDRQVMAHAGNAPPRYPALLRSAGVEGLVHAQFVVDTAGRVERESIRFARSDHQLFDRAVTEALLRSRYAPAEAGGRKVRQLVEQAFSFALQR
jgi:protein TonB